MGWSSLEFLDGFDSELVLEGWCLRCGAECARHWVVKVGSARFPQVTIDPNVLYVDNGTVLTAAGSAAAIDVSLHIVRKDLGAQVASAVAREMVTAPHRSGGQAKFVPAEATHSREAESLSELLEWMLARLDQDLPLQTIARQANTSSRTLSRQFVAQVGVTPHQWLIEQRVLKAQSLLEQGEPVEAVAQRVGFRTGAVLRVHFARLTSTSPAAYQRTFTHALDRGVGTPVETQRRIDQRRVDHACGPEARFSDQGTSGRARHR